MDLVKDERVIGRSGPLPSNRQPVAEVVHDFDDGKFLTPPRGFDPEHPELIDRPGLDPALLREELRALATTNRRFGGHQLALHYVQRLFGAKAKTSCRILDLGTGAADVPRAIVAWARQQQLPVSVTAVDGNPDVLCIARELSRDWPEIKFEHHDLRALPFPADSYDLVMCSLALHHFTAADAVGILRRMQEMARVGYILNDLRRNWPAIWMSELLARTVIKSRIARHDGPHSCRAAFTVHELETMARQAGLTDFRIARHQLFFRMVLEGRK